MALMKTVLTAHHTNATMDVITLVELTSVLIYVVPSMSLVAL